MTRVAEVIVDLPSWRLDRPLSYSIPEKLGDVVRVGSIVRVPLRGRRVRGWVVEVGDRDAGRELSEIAQVSGRGPAFDPQMLEVCRACARRYVQPLAAFLNLVTPPRLGRARAAAPAEPDRHSRSKEVVPPELWVLGPSENPVPRYEELVRKTIDEGFSAIVCAPEVREGSAMLERLARTFPNEAAVVHSGVDPAPRSTALWEATFGRKRLILGGRAAALTPSPSPGLVIIHSEHDPALKEQRSPYYDAREVALIRSEISGSRLLLTSPTPSLTTVLAAEEGWDVVEGDRETARRVWPAVEILEPAGGRAQGGGIPRRAVAAIIEARRRGGRVIVFLPRAKATSAGPGPAEVARFVERVVPDAVVKRADRQALGAPGELTAALQADVVIATEAALAEVPRPKLSTAIALGIDAFFKRPQGRSVEDGFAILWSLGALLVSESEPKSNRRLLLETGQPDHYVVQALARGDYGFFASRELEVRDQLDLPPFTNLIRMRSKEFPLELLERLQDLPGSELLGPVDSERRSGSSELLLKADAVESVVDPLRDILSSIDFSVNIEVDPKDW